MNQDTTEVVRIDQVEDQGLVPEAYLVHYYEEGKDGSKKRCITASLEPYPPTVMPSEQNVAKREMIKLEPLFSSEFTMERIGFLQRPLRGTTCVVFVQTADVIPLGLHETLSVYIPKRHP